MEVHDWVHLGWLNAGIIVEPKGADLVAVWFIVDDLAVKRERVAVTIEGFALSKNLLPFRTPECWCQGVTKVYLTGD